MGKNVPKGYGEDESVAGDKKSHGINIGMNNLQAKKKGSVIVMFKSLFDKYLKIKYKFYAELFEEEKV